jgi:hypothetical protein
MTHASGLRSAELEDRFMCRLKIALVWLIVGAVIGAPVALAIIGMAPSHPSG